MVKTDQLLSSLKGYHNNSTTNNQKQPFYPTNILPPQEVIPTAEITHKELATARKAAGMLQHQVARHLHVSDDVISDWETGKSRPDPDQVSDLEQLYKAPGLWHGWMRYHYQSYRDRYPEIPDNSGLAIAMVNAKYQAADMLQCQDAAIRDALDGRIDDRKAFAEYIRQAKEAHAALGEMLARAEMEA